jgi:sugar O-acyltransferase (sialic acid O-acetyltransferase NeuD family)
MDKTCLVIGAGGHARAVVSTLLRKKEFDILAVLDHAREDSTESILGVKVIGAKKLLTTIKSLETKNLFLAIGDNKSRKTLFEELRSQGFDFPNHVAITSVLSQEVKLGAGNILFENTFIGPLCEIGDNNIFNNGSVFEHESRLNSHSHMGPNSTVAGRVKLGSEVFLGVGSCVIPSVNVADGTILGAGAVLTDSTFNPGVYVGMPARQA